MKTDKTGHAVMPMAHIKAKHYGMKVGQLPTDMGGPLSNAKAREMWKGEKKIVRLKTQRRVR